MDPTDPTSNRTSPPSPGHATTQGDARQVHEANRFRRHLEADPAGQQRSVRQRRRNALLPNPGGPADIFAEAGARTTVRHVATAQETQDVLVSVRDRKVGSVYLPFGRVRTTHFAGPGASVMPPDSILRFNIDHRAALDAFRQARPDALDRATEMRDRSLPPDRQRMAVADAFLDMRDAWIAEILSAADTPPAWASRVTGPESVDHIDDLDPGSDRVMFEILDQGPGQAPRTHVSRGEMARMPMSAQTLMAIGRALDLIENVRDPVRRNEIFYDYIGSHAPDLADVIRRP